MQVYRSKWVGERERGVVEGGREGREGGGREEWRERDRIELEVD